MKSNFLLIILTLISCASFFFISCSDDGDSEDPYWEVELDGEEFAKGAGPLVYTDGIDNNTFTVEKKKPSSDERILINFNVEDGFPFEEKRSLQFSPSSEHQLRYFDSQEDEWSSLNGNSIGTFFVDRFIQTDSTLFIEGTLNGNVFNKTELSSVSISGDFAAKIF